MNKSPIYRPITGNHHMLSEHFIFVIILLALLNCGTCITDRCDHLKAETLLQTNKKSKLFFVYCKFISIISSTLLYWKQGYLEYTLMQKFGKLIVHFM